MSTSILIADDQALVRTGFRMILEAESDFRVVGEAKDGADAVEVARRCRPDVVLMDIRMPRMDGLEATRRIIEAGAAGLPRVLMLTTFDRDEYVTKRSKRAPAASCSKTHHPKNSPLGYASSPPANRCSPQASPAA